MEVAQKHRGQGVASELLRRIEDSARAPGSGSIWLHVDEGNGDAIRLYERHGYQRQGREEHYYARNRNAFIYAKTLEPVA